MNCDDIAAQLQRGELPSSEAALAHLEDCAPCAERVADAELGPSDTAESSEAQAALRRDVARALSTDARSTTGWLRSRSTGTRLALGLGTALLFCGLVPLARVRADLAVYPQGRLLLTVAALGGLVGVALSFAIEPVHRAPRPALWRWAWLLSALGVPFAIAAAPIAHLGHAASFAGIGDDLWPKATTCLVLGALAALPVLVVLRSIDRREHAASSRALVAAAGAGAAGNLALSLHCPITSPLHLLCGHALLGVIFVLGYGGAARWLRG